jgi:hypothetical protein
LRLLEGAALIKQPPQQRMIDADFHGEILVSKGTLRVRADGNTCTKAIRRAISQPMRERSIACMVPVNDCRVAPGASVKRARMSGCRCCQRVPRAVRSGAARPFSRVFISICFY